MESKAVSKAIRIPAWLLEISQAAIDQVGAEDLSKYIRGLMLKHAQSLCLSIPEGTEKNWPEWVKKQTSKEKYEIEPF